MFTQKQRISPRANEILLPLKNRFFTQQLIDSSGTWWELRFIFQPGLLRNVPFDMNIAVVLTCNNNPKEGQHIAYFQLVSEVDHLRLRWLLRPFDLWQAAVDDFESLYPLPGFIEELQNTITAYPVRVDIPGWEQVSRRSAMQA